MDLRQKILEAESSTAQWHTGIRAAQSSDVSGNKKRTPQQSIAILPSDVLSDLKEIKADIVLLKDLKAEVSQIRESIHKTEPAQKLYSPTSKETDYGTVNHPVYVQPQFAGWNRESATAFHHPDGPMQEYRATGGPRLVTGTAQFQQRFAPQRYSMPRPRPRCIVCQQRGEEYCQHCYRCRSGEHLHAGCIGYRGQSSVGRETPLN